MSPPLRWRTAGIHCRVAGYALTVFAMTACAADRPNIIVYLSDDHSQADSSVYGNQSIPMPHLERLAADGMTFTHAFVASPSCAPSRAAMLTALMPARNGAEANHTKPRSDAHILTQDLQAAGYEVAAFGKVAHNKSISDYGLDYLGDDGLGYLGGASTCTQLRDAVAAYLCERKSEKPLCLLVGTTNPHVPWTNEPTFDPDDVELPPHQIDTPATRRHRAAYYEEIKELDELLGELRTIADEHLGPNTLFLHSSDHGSQWPFGKWNLYDYGIRVPLVVAWPEQIEAGSKTNAMVSWVDLLPTLIEVVGGSCPDDLDGRSFAAVLRGQQGEHRDRIFTTHTGDGRKNIYPMRSVRTREWKLIHNLHPEYAHTNHSDLDRKPMAGRYWNQWANKAMRDESARKIVDRYYKRPEWELYRVAEDRWELNNLVDDPAYASIVEELKRELDEWTRQQGDKEMVHAEPRPPSDPKQWRPDFFKGGSAKNR